MTSQSETTSGSSTDELSQKQQQAGRAIASMRDAGTRVARRISSEMRARPTVAIGLGLGLGIVTGALLGRRAMGIAAVGAAAYLAGRRWLRVPSEAREGAIPAGDQPNEGEGSRSAARAYDEKATRAARHARHVERAAARAERDSRGPEGKELRDAEEKGKRAEHR